MFSVDSMSRIPVYEQIITQVEKYVSLGILKPGDALPSVRNLSVSLSVNPNTIQKTFGDLLARGIIFSVPGRGSFISNDAREIVNQKSRSKLTEFKELARELFLAGVSLDELYRVIAECGAPAAEPGSSRV